MPIEECHVEPENRISARRGQQKYHAGYKLMPRTRPSEQETGAAKRAVRRDHAEKIVGSRPVSELSLSAFMRFTIPK